jgi:hypothetical protein
MNNLSIDAGARTQDIHPLDPRLGSENGGSQEALDRVCPIANRSAADPEYFRTFPVDADSEFFRTLPAADSEIFRSLLAADPEFFRIGNGFGLVVL